MANISSPLKRSGTKGLPPPEGEASANLNKSSSKELKHLNFYVPAELKKRFKQRSLDEEISMRDLFEKCFNFYLTQKQG